MSNSSRSAMTGGRSLHSVTPQAEPDSCRQHLVAFLRALIAPDHSEWDPDRAADLVSRLSRDPRLWSISQRTPRSRRVVVAASPFPMETGPGSSV